MEENKRYYWLKLKRDFFRRHDIQIVENMPNGKDYILFYRFDRPFFAAQNPHRQGFIHSAQ